MSSSVQVSATSKRTTTPSAERWASVRSEHLLQSAACTLLCTGGLGRCTTIAQGLGLWCDWSQSTASTDNSLVQSQVWNHNRVECSCSEFMKQRYGDNPLQAFKLTVGRAALQMPRRRRVYGFLFVYILW